jgi:hypothetical protein
MVAYWSCVPFLIASDLLRALECSKCERRGMGDASPFSNSLYPGVPSTLVRATVYNRLPRSLILTNLSTRTVRRWQQLLLGSVDALYQIGHRAAHGSTSCHNSLQENGELRFQRN